MNANRSSTLLVTLVSTALTLAACAPPPAREASVSPKPTPPAVVSGRSSAPPALRLPDDVRPTAERLELSIDPSRDRFEGTAEITVTLDQARDVIWMHGEGLHVTRAAVMPDGGAEVLATWTDRGARGLAALTLTRVVPAGRAKIRIAYDAPFKTALDGLYKTRQAGVPYAFTQFEAIEARTAFPCFDEPGFKIPWDVTLIVPSGAQAIANTREVHRTDSGGRLRIDFAPTLPLPSYLLAFAVGPLEVVTAPDVPTSAVRHRPLPLRGITAKGRGKEIAYALAHTGEILATLESYFGIEYPYDKLDILAVPDKGGAMENPGAVTFGEWLVLMDERTAPLDQRRAYAYVMAHELAHQWFGDLVTMQWWDDTWLNEAFATWMGSKAADAWDPRSHAETAQLSRALGIMDGDGHVSARSIRQPIASPDDIANAFDDITYRKGGAVIRMFERWLGPDEFQRGVRDHLARHRFGNATADDFLAAISRAAGKDVKAAFQTFLDQPGVPLVQTELRCDGAPRVHLKQSRYLPAGSAGSPDHTWQFPVCVRAADGKATRVACTLLTSAEGDLSLGKAGDRCPAWYMPNADANGYYRFSMSAADRARLAPALGALTTRERVAVGDSVRAAFSQGTLGLTDLLDVAAPFARDPEPEVARVAMRPLRLAHDWLHGDVLASSVEAYARELYHPAYQSLGWTRRAADDDARVELRGDVIQFLGRTGHDPGVRAEAARRAGAFLGLKDGALHPEGVDRDVADAALSLAGESADAAEWARGRDALAKTDDEAVRSSLLGFLGAAQRPELSVKALDLSLDPVLRVTEIGSTLWVQRSIIESREAAWQWVKAHFDALVARVSLRRASGFVWMPAAFCDEEHAADAEAFFTPRLAGMEGGPRVLAETLEQIRLCAALRKAQEPGVRSFFVKRK